ncbi:MAG TPA: SDR family oxidoreductase [Candidatus Kapabacteria bacterium]|nr:SDR family oxidoreductase [Candidatus Kapabacteria bacterium]
MSILRPRRRETVFLTGVHGFLGQHTLRTLLDESRSDLVLSSRQEKLLYDDLGNEPRIIGYESLDLSDRIKVRDTLLRYKPDVIVNCASLVDVNAAERERETAWKANVRSVEYIIEAARRLDARIVHISSDYVFDGSRSPYSEIGTPNPVNYYGRTKLASENALKSSGIPHLVIRTSMLYGAEVVRLHSRENFVLHTLHKIRKNEVVSAYTNLSSNPTLVDDVALSIVRAIELQKTGLYHVAGPELRSRYELAVQVADTFRLDASFIRAVEFAPSKEEGIADRPRSVALVSLKAQTELGVKCSGVSEGLQVMARGLQNISETKEVRVYE